jgi:serine/threonine protein kinase
MEQLNAKVIDFGISKLWSIEQKNTKHITTMVKGTPSYIDPK